MVKLGSNSYKLWLLFLSVAIGLPTIVIFLGLSRQNFVSLNIYRAEKNNLYGQKSQAATNVHTTLHETKNIVSLTLNETNVNCTVDFRSPILEEDDEFTKRIKQRIVKAEESCQRIMTPKEVYWRAGSNIVVDQRNDVLFVLVRKVGSTSWEQIFSHITIPKYKNYTQGRINSIPYPFKDLVHLSKFEWDEANAILEEYYKIVFVREPFYRLLSAFQNKMLHVKNPYYRDRYGKYITIYEKTFAKEVNPKTGRKIDEGLITFRSFFRYLARTNPSAYDVHWNCYMKNALPCGMKYDFIGKLETMKEDFNFLSRCKLNVGTYDEIFTEGATSTTDIYNEFFATVEDEDVIKVYEKFQQDYKIFDYPMPEIVKKAKERTKMKIIVGNLSKLPI